MTTPHLLQDERCDIFECNIENFKALVNRLNWVYQYASGPAYYKGKRQFELVNYMISILGQEAQDYFDNAKKERNK